ncbi:DUF4365 domain-containing protein [Kovacikia minuta CCNUW1]|uniref:DUF4365 domain-containing protein n=1 Tax=Kovacikia minuta TaxID=2931930 RepID=UPI001CCDF37F|nr:DUF4365 domain-containing protein [Kovacikia minuta]UBF24533.1 DUF4365 domain-containing protein [Kovacikia minuta CCNUW1]
MESNEGVGCGVWGVGKKKRTRQPIIADLSVNHVERYVLSCGYSVERVEYDYGIDLVIFTYSASGEIENGQIYVQLKATDSLEVLADRETIPFSLKRSDLELWLKEPMPYILIVYDAQADMAYWLYLQAYFENQPGFDLSQIGETATVHLRKANIVNQAAIRKFAEYKQDILAQLQEVIRHHDS